MAPAYDVAVDSAGRLYAANQPSVKHPTGSVTVYARNWASGNTPPIKTLAGAPEQTLLRAPIGIAFDSAQRMYIANQYGGINVYAADWADGATAPVKVLDTSELGRPLYIAFDSTGRMYATFLTNEGPSLVAAFARDWTSSSSEQLVRAEPLKILSGPSTGLGAQALGIAFDASDRMYVVTSGASLEDRISAVNVYAADWASGDTAPIKRLEGDQTGLGSQSVDVAIDYLGRMNVSNVEGSSVTIYAPDWASGNTRPLTAHTSMPPNPSTRLGVAAEERSLAH